MEAATAQGKETVLGVVLMQSGANSRLVANRCVEKLKVLSLLDEAEINIHYTRSFPVDHTIQTVTKNLLEGSGLVILVLVMLVGDFRSGPLVASVMLI